MSLICFDPSIEKKANLSHANTNSSTEYSNTHSIAIMNLVYIFGLCFADRLSQLNIAHVMDFKLDKAAETRKQINTKPSALGH